MLTCKDVCDNATNYLEGPTTFQERLALRFHLLICRHCRRFLKQFRTMVGAVNEPADLPEPSDEEIDALVRKLSSQSADP